MLVLLLKKLAMTKNDEIERKLHHGHSNKYITTQEFNNLSTKLFKAKLKQAN